MLKPHRPTFTAILPLCGLLAACGGSSTSPSAPRPEPSATPAPAGTIRFIGATLPAGSTVPVAPMFGNGQQAQSLSFRGAVTVTRNLDEALVRAYVRTENQICMGGGIAHLSLRAGVEMEVAPLSMSRSDPPFCALPYTTTFVEFEVYDTVTQSSVVTQRFPMTYTFVAGP